ncbi:MAG TPA: zf-HC2 domain-containing protein, partial [Solirubrobacteraceae bacterium]
MTPEPPQSRGPDAAMVEALDAHGAAVWAYAEAVVPASARQVASEAVAAARAELPAAGRAAGSPAVARAALNHHLRRAAAGAVVAAGHPECAGVPEAIAALANGELSAAGERDLRAHVAGCADCEALAERFTTGERLLGSAPGGPVPLWLYEAAAGRPAQRGGRGGDRRAGGRGRARATAGAAA